MLLFIVGFFTPYLFISFHFVIDGNEIVANDQLNDGVDNCRSKAKLIDGDKVVEEPKSGMLFGSIEEVVDYYRNYGKQAGFGVTQKKKFCFFPCQLSWFGAQRVHPKQVLVPYHIHSILNSNFLVLGL